jgi:hypothetical protein
MIGSLRQEDECIAAGGQHYLTGDKTCFQRSVQNNEMLLLKIESILNVTVKKGKGNFAFLHSMKIHKVTEVWLHLFLNLALDARDGRINPSGGLPPSTH